MIDFIKAFPNPTQFEEFDCEDEYKERLDSYVQSFNRRRERTVNILALIDSELKSLEERKDGINSPIITKSLDGIDLYPLFKQGWDWAISGLGCIVLNNSYKWCPEIKEQISAKYSEQDPPPNYFEVFSKISMEEVIEGMACAKYYYWLKDQENEKDKPLSKFNTNQLIYIFDEMVKLKNFEKPQKQVFLDTFQGKTGIKRLKWMGAKSLIRYFFEQMTGRDNILPSEINNYIEDPIESKHKHEGSAHLPIKRVFAEVIKLS
jgi:hypothetical protein